jgi:flagellar motility protein MotE (MotC chaperone)
MADVDEGQELSPKELKKKEKEEKKAAKKAAKGGGFDAVATDQGGFYADIDDEDEGFSPSVLLIVILIVLIWIAILALLIKLDIGGFGSGVLRPILKDVPVINKILPEPTEAEEYAGEFDNLPDALAEIERLNKQIDELKAEIAKGGEGESEEIKALKEEIVRLRTFEESQVEFQKLKTEFYEEVVFSDKAPEIEQYMAYYEEIDPDNAEYLYKQVVAQIETDKIMDEYITGYTEMKPKQAAAIFDEMGDNLDLVAKILGNMEPSARAKILQAMDKDLASKLTKIMDPD